MHFHEVSNKEAH